MNELAVSSTRTRPLGTAQQALPGSASTSFHDLLASLSAPAAPAQAVVQRGDCLSQLCADRLRELGRPASHREILAAVQKVAQANHLADPNRIQAGQRLDLSALSGGPGQSGSAVPAIAQPTLADRSAVLTSSFGLRKDPFTGQVRQHNGVDLAAPSGTPVSACAAGSVTFSGWKPGYGNTVIIHHENGLDSLYGHLLHPLVQAGDQVAAHTQIASVGSNGRSTGPHLHFELRRNGKPLDPLAAQTLP